MNDNITCVRQTDLNEIMLCKYKYNDMIIYNKVNATKKKKKNINMIDIVVNK